MKVFVLDSHSIYRRGLAASLAQVDAVGSVAQAGSVREAWEHRELFDSDVVILDAAVADGYEFIRRVAEATGAAVIVCTADCTHASLVAALEAGAVGFLRKETLTPAGLNAAVQAAGNGTGVVAPDLLRGMTVDAHEADRPVLGRLTEREQQVLSLIAQGHATRDVALELCYSERTVKNVLHDVVTKLNARSRSHAVAHAVREGLI